MQNQIILTEAHAIGNSADQQKAQSGSQTFCNSIYIGHRNDTIQFSMIKSKLSHGNSYIFYEVANSYEFVRPHSYDLVRFV